VSACVAATGHWLRKGALAGPAMIAKPKYEQAIPFDYQFNPEIYLSDRPKDLISAVTARHGDPPVSSLQETGQRSVTRRCDMRKFIAALALISLIAIPSLTVTANAAPVSPSSSSFGSNGY